VFGDDLLNSADITDTFTSHQIARISREMVSIVKNISNYHVIVAPNVDLAIMAGICICLDDRWEGDKFYTPFFPWSS
jgi:uncharacterized protein YxjI